MSFEPLKWIHHYLKLHKITIFSNFLTFATKFFWGFSLKKLLRPKFFPLEKLVLNNCFTIFSKIFFIFFHKTAQRTIILPFSIRFCYFLSKNCSEKNCFSRKIGLKKIVLLFEVYDFFIVFRKISQKKIKCPFQYDFFTFSQELHRKKFYLVKN